MAKIGEELDMKKTKFTCLQMNLHSYKFKIYPWILYCVQAILLLPWKNLNIILQITFV